MSFFFSRPELAAGDAARLRRIENKLDLILQHLGIEYHRPQPGQNLDSEVRRLADAGRKIPAIKRHRELTGDGLREAKEAVEAYLHGH